MRLNLGAPVFFRQERPGLHEKIFRLYKFRSMRVNPSQDTAWSTQKDSRKTAFGTFIRKYSLDEFPQFWNVLKGDMSLVGTRPPTVDEWKQYEAHHRARLAVKPGITGLWQISGRSDIKDFEEVVALDLQYMKEWSIGRDIEILWKTVVAVLTMRGSE